MKKLCTSRERTINIDTMIFVSWNFVKKKSRQRKAAAKNTLLFAEGFAVGALVHSGVHLMGTHQDAVQGAVVLILAMMGALLDGAFDTFVGMTVHCSSSFEFEFGYSMARRKKSMLEKVSSIAFSMQMWYFEKKK